MLAALGPQQILVLSQGSSLDPPEGWSWSGLGLPRLPGSSAVLAVGMAEGPARVWEPGDAAP